MRRSKEEEEAMSRALKIPSHNLCVQADDTDRWTQVGVAWANGKGGFSIKLDPATVLRWNDKLTIYLFENKKGKRR